jgi:hypothetical protein
MTAPKDPNAAKKSHKKKVPPKAPQDGGSDSEIEPIDGDDGREEEETPPEPVAAAPAPKAPQKKNAAKPQAPALKKLEDVVAAAPSTARARVFKGSIVMVHDLFKLLLSTMVKDVGFNPEKPVRQEIEHVHFFHTIDSNGRKQLYSNAVGGHFHACTVVETDGVPEIKIGPPLKAVRKKVRGGWVTAHEAIRCGDEVDNHTHAVEYIRSEEIKMRDHNTHANQFISAEATKAVIPADLAGTFKSA